MFRLVSNLAGRQTLEPASPPAWARALVGERFMLVSECVTGAAQMTPSQFEQRTFEAYISIADRIRRSACRHPVRFWNHVPFITEPADTERDNYMVFNAGRFRAFSDLLGGPGCFDREVATASAIGHRASDLVIHCLAADTPASAVNNPRQVAPYHYSQRFGPLPPCFARATRLAHPCNVLLVGGTASVRGEDSVHTDDLAGQLAETFLNLATLLFAASGRRTSPTARVLQHLHAFRDLRVYHPNRSDAAEIELAVRRAFPRLGTLEFLPADLCRAELLVEIEGLAELPR